MRETEGKEGGRQTAGGSEMYVACTCVCGVLCAQSTW